MSPLHVLFLFIASTCSSTEVEVEDNCPSANIKPCTCKTYLDGACIVTCSLSSQVDIDRVADIPNLCNGHVHFMLVHSKVSGIPARLWRALLSSKTVDVSIKHAGMEGLVPPGTESIGKVSTPGAADIVVDHSNVGKWDWKELEGFNSEGELTIVVDDTPLAELGKDFSRIGGGRVHKVTIDSTGLTRVEDEQFVPFDDLSSLSLQNNQLTSVSRSMMARPAKSLQFLHLNGNSLSTIPGDLFSEMPVLEVVYLRDNNLKHLPQEIFQSVSPKLQRVDLVNNPWECNCDLMWIIKKKQVFANLGNCATPQSLSGKKVKNLPDLLEC